MLIEVPIKLAFKMKNNETGIFGKIISFVTRSKYYHVEIIIDKLWVLNLLILLKAIKLLRL
jgi:hypothetical protein